MESIKNNAILEFQPNPVETLRKRYNLDNGRMEQSVDILEDWIKKQKHFVSSDFDRDYLERSIFICKGSVEKAKRQTDRLCTLRTLVPRFFIFSEDNRKHLRELFDIASVVILPKQTKDYDRVLIAKLSDKEFNANIVMIICRFSIILCEYLKSRDFSDGHIAIFDLREANIMDIMMKLNPVDLQQILTVMIEGYGARIKGVHLMSHSKLIDILIKAVKPFLSQKIAGRIYTLQENEELLSFVDRDVLPIEYGGTDRSLYELNDMWFDEFTSPKFESYLARVSSMCTNESLRLSDKFNEDCIGLPGSFRTLSVD